MKIAFIAGGVKEIGVSELKIKTIIL